MISVLNVMSFRSHVSRLALHSAFDAHYYLTHTFSGPTSVSSSPLLPFARFRLRPHLARERCFVPLVRPRFLRLEVSYFNVH